MSNRKLQEFDLYQYGPRGVLRPGDLFRVSGGPYYENEDGSKTLMAERACSSSAATAKGASRWIEATRVGGGTVVLWVGKAGPNKDLPSFRRKPYKIRKVTERKRKSRKKEASQLPYARPSKRWARARMPTRLRPRSRPGRRPAGPRGPNRGPSPKSNLGLPRPGREVAKNAGKTGSREGR